MTLKNSVEAYEKLLISRALRDCRYNMRKAAKDLGVQYQTLFNKAKKYGLLKSQARSGEDCPDNTLLFKLGDE